MQPLRIERTGPVGAILIDRPERRNAFTTAMWLRFAELVDQAGDDPQIRVVTIESGVEGVFSAGADVDQLRRELDDSDRAAVGLDHIREAFARLARLSKPTVALVDGPCHGGAVGLALCADVRMATTRATFSIPAARLGVVYPFPALQRLMWTVGTGQARRLLFTAASVSAKEAAQIGLVDSLVDVAQLATEREALLASMAELSGDSIAWTKSLMETIERGAGDGDAALGVERRALAGPHHREGVAAFLEKRAPRFS